MKKILLFEFQDLNEILRIAAAARRRGAELRTVSRADCGLTLEALSRGESGGRPAAPPMEKMLVFCGLERELDGLLAELRQEGVACLKAVLTPDNRTWTPERLCRELERERRAVGGK